MHQDAGRFAVFVFSYKRIKTTEYIGVSQRKLVFLRWCQAIIFVSQGESPFFPFLRVNLCRTEGTQSADPLCVLRAFAPLRELFFVRVVRGKFLTYSPAGLAISPLRGCASPHFPQQRHFLGLTPCYFSSSTPIRVHYYASPAFSAPLRELFFLLLPLCVSAWGLLPSSRYCPGRLICVYLYWVCKSELTRQAMNRSHEGSITAGP